MESAEQSRCIHCVAYEEEIAKLKGMIKGLVERVAAQSELLSKRAERPEAPKVESMITFPKEKS